MVCSGGKTHVGKEDLGCAGVRGAVFWLGEALRVEGVSLADTWGKGDSRYKGLEFGACLAYLRGTSRSH